MDFDRVTRETASTPATGTATSSASSTATSAVESNSATQDTLVDLGGVEAAEPDASTLSGRQVGVLANFGIGPENLDDEAQARMAHAIGRLDGMLACTGGDEAVCAALGPAPINLSDATSADGNEQEFLLEESDYTLSLRVSTDPLTGETTSRILYIDADGTYISGLSNQPIEALFAPEPTPELEADAQPEEKSWLATVAGIDADYDVLTRLGAAMQVAGGAADLTVAIPLLLAPEPVLTKVAAAGAGLRGLDDLQAGLQTLVTGEPTETVTQTVATDAAVAMGADPDSAKTIGLAVDMVTGILNPAGRLRHMTTEMSERLAKEAAEQAGKHGDDAARAVRVEEAAGEQGSKLAAEGHATDALRSGNLDDPAVLAGLSGPASRHRLSSVTTRTVAKDLNSVVEPGVDVAGDLAAIRAGKAVRSGDTFAVNGRTYGVHDGTLYPVSGAGVHQLDRGAFKALGVYQEQGLTDRAAWILDRMKISPAQREAAEAAWRAGQNVE